MKWIYLDNSATTPVFAEVAARVQQALCEAYFNPSATYLPAVEAMDAREAVRKQVLAASGMRGQVIFTSGGTEADNLAILGTAGAEKGLRYITTAVEHAAVREAFAHLQQRGHEIIVLGVDKGGQIDLQALRAAVNERTRLVSVMQVNNETGALLDVAAIARVAKAVNPKVLVHTDAVQGFLRVHESLQGVDMLSLSAHKLHAPKGTGALIVGNGVQLKCCLHGGGQEMGLRSGTENMPGILGLGAALRQFEMHGEAYVQQLRALKLRLCAGLLQLPQVTLNGPEPHLGAPHIVNASFEGVRAATLQQALCSEGVLVGTGSACKSRGARVSAVLNAMGVPTARAQGAIRFSLGVQNTPEEIDQTLRLLPGILQRLRKYVRR